MKKTVAIFSIAILLLSIFRFGVSSHYCCGKYVSSVWGIAGKKAGCGMKEDIPCDKSQHSSLAKKCCENISLSVDTDKYTPQCISFCKTEVCPNAWIENTPSLSIHGKFSSEIIIAQKAPPPAGISVYTLRVLRI